MLQKDKKILKKRRYLYKLINWGILAILFFSLSGLPGLARDVPTKFPFLNPQQQQQTEPKQPVLPVPDDSRLNDPREFEAFVDNLLSEEMSKSHIPGAVISVVKDGKLFFAKGYGYANVEKKIPVVADKTLFRVASISKLFTATAAMQLYERGLLDLNADVNKYLKHFQLENPFPQPVTPAQMMTHTDGTTQRLIGIAAPTAAQMEPLAAYLSKHMPPVVWPPGELYSYSNHSIVLLGYLVELISGRPFVQYVDENIFRPLGISRSTFLQPPPPNLADDLAVGYQHQNGTLNSLPYLYLNIAPAASLSTTATDMAQFMIAHLQGGRYENSRILEENTVQLMHETHFSQHPQLPGTGYGFRENLENNIRAIGHLGNLRGYSSSLTLLPNQNIGIFIATNSFSGVHGKLLTQFFDRYFPVAQKPAPLQRLTLTEEQLEQFTGTYRGMEYPRNTLAKLTAPFEHINITKGNNGTLLVRTPSLFFLKNAPNVRLVPVELLLFQRDDGAFTGFGKDRNGQISFAFNPILPKIGAFERVPWYETIWVQLGIAGFCAVVFLSACIVWPIHPVIQRLHRKLSGRAMAGNNYGREKHLQIERRLNQAWLLAGLVTTLNLVFLIGFPLSLWLIGVWKLIYGVPRVAIALLYIPLLTTVLTVSLPIFTAFAWKNTSWSVGGRLHYSLITLAALAFIPFLAYWNLLGFQF